MATRVSVGALSDDQVTKIQGAFVALKRERLSVDGRSTYDRYVLIHQQAMDHLTLWPQDDVSGARRNAAHRGPAFLPWHRSYLWRLERDLQRVADDDQIALPYWDWTIDAAAVNQAQDNGDPLPSLSVERVIGPPGTPINVGVMVRYFVRSGPFGIDINNLNSPDNWWAVNTRGHEVLPLERRYGQDWDPNREGPRPRLPETEDVTGANGVLQIADYDSAPWDQSSTDSFRNVLEGFEGPGLHNIVHQWVGGSMLPETSPNDPVFFLHHCNVDRIWAAWQVGRPISDYLPQGGGPAGHNAVDSVFPWNGIDSQDLDSPAALWDYRGDLGYEYDVLP